MRYFALILVALFLVIGVDVADARVSPPKGQGEDAVGTVPKVVSLPAAEVNPDDVLAADIAAVMKSKWKRSKGHHSTYGRLAKLFVKNGRRWKVDPVLIACVAAAESRFRLNPPKLMAKVCREQQVGCSKPGPCWRHRWKTVCKRKQINVAESGMMQVLWYDRSTREGYKQCTGKKLFSWRWGRAKRKRIAQKTLSKPEVGICVGSYELSKWKKWALYGGYGKIRCKNRSYKPKAGAIRCHKRMKPRAKRNVRFFAKYPLLRPLFWVSFYNWGSNAWKGNHYPRRVLYCYHQYKQAINGMAVARSQGPVGNQRAQIKK